MIEGRCHCGAVRFRLKADPEWLTECNCSICRRVGALWAHAEIADIDIERAEDSTIAYIWGDRLLALHSCKTCGCTTHWENLTGEHSRMAVNCHMADPEAIKSINVRHFDGAESWSYLD